MIVKPPFMFGETEIYTRDPEAWIAILVVLLASIFLLSNAYTLVRFLRGKHINHSAFLHKSKKVFNHVCLPSKFVKFKKIS